MREGWRDDQSPKPRHVWNRIPIAVRRKAVKRALTETDLSPRELAVTFTGQESSFISKTSVYRVLKAHEGKRLPCSESITARMRNLRRAPKVSGRKSRDQHWFRSNAACQRIARIFGVGPKTAIAVIAAVGDGRAFKNGRHLAAWMGLVPRQHSSGNRQILMGISKHGDQHLRTLLVHGARSVVRVAAGKTDALSRWIHALRERRGVNRTIVATANKKARIFQAVLRKDMEFQPTN